MNFLKITIIGITSILVLFGVSISTILFLKYNPEPSSYKTPFANTAEFRLEEKDYIAIIDFEQKNKKKRLIEIGIMFLRERFIHPENKDAGAIDSVLWNTVTKYYAYMNNPTFIEVDIVVEKLTIDGWMQVGKMNHVKADASYSCDEYIFMRFDAIGLEKCRYRVTIKNLKPTNDFLGRTVKIRAIYTLPRKG